MSNNLIYRLFSIASIAVLLAIPNARADFEITVESGTIDPDGQLLLQIGIESNAPPQGISEFELILEIASLTSTGSSSLQFVSPQSEAFTADADYVFANNSESVAEGLSTVDTLSTTGITFVDLTANFLDEPVTTGQLIASIDLSHNLNGTAAAATAGDQYQIRVNPGSEFVNEGGTAIAFLSTPGVVTVDVVAIPEPGALAVLMFGCCGMVLRRNRRR